MVKPVPARKKYQGCKYFTPQDRERPCHHPNGLAYCYTNLDMACPFRNWILSHFYPIPEDQIFHPKIVPSKVVVR